MREPIELLNSIDTDELQKSLKDSSQAQYQSEMLRLRDSCAELQTKLEASERALAEVKLDTERLAENLTNWLSDQKYGFVSRQHFIKSLAKQIDTARQSAKPEAQG